MTKTVGLESGACCYVEEIEPFTRALSRRTLNDVGGCGNGGPPDLGLKPVPRPETRRKLDRFPKPADRPARTLGAFDSLETCRYGRNDCAAPGGLEAKGQRLEALI